MRYDHANIEKKWREVWEKEGAAKTDKDDAKKEKYYVLDMFPYPSGDGLHMGHAESYTASDIVYRYKKMRGFNVLHPQGFDAFGLPAENYAVKTGVHPKKTTEKNIATYIAQMKSLGLGYDFDESIVTADPSYYKWTQWFFTRFLRHGLAYKKTDRVNWCESCKTVLANEQVEGGACERCKNPVIQKDVPGWFLKITDFADELIEGLEDLDWPEHTKKNQIHWIGKSTGAEIDFPVADGNEKITVFTTRPDTLFGATYCVLAPEHALVSVLRDRAENKEEIDAYVRLAARKTEKERIADEREKTGVALEGVRAVNPATKEEIPVFIADYVLAHYGTGAVMAVPAHDERDFAFAKKFGLPVREVVSGGDISQGAFTGDGVLVNSGKFTGTDSREAKKAITDFVGGKMTATYRLRDWSVSRQRYWGAPIPVVYDPDGKAHPVPDEHLPWLLPDDVDFVPTGVAPLEKSRELHERTEKIFGAGWTPETDTLDTFVCSSWYFLRYPDPHNDKRFASEKRVKRWLPVDLYIGGAEHTYMHLLYARFFMRALHSMGLVPFPEPFPKLRHQGLVLDEKGVKMSKSKGNVVNPDDMVRRFGADAVRLYVMFAGPLEDDILWNEDGAVGMHRFIEKVWKTAARAGDAKETAEIERAMHATIKKVTDDVENLRFNTAISALMIFTNLLAKEDTPPRSAAETLVLLLAPFAPFVAEEIWRERFGKSVSVFSHPWPAYDEKKIASENVRIVVQVGGKVRGAFDAPRGLSEEEARERALGLPGVKKWTDGKEVKKVIVVPDKIVSIVV